MGQNNQEKGEESSSEHEGDDDSWDNVDHKAFGDVLSLDDSENVWTAGHNENRSTGSWESVESGESWEKGYCSRSHSPECQESKTPATGKKKKPAKTCKGSSSAPCNLIKPKKISKKQKNREAARAKAIAQAKANAEGTDV